MKQLSKTFLLLLVFIASFSVFAVPPQSIHYQAYLKNNAGLPVNGSQNITFRLYDAVTAGTQLWNETQTVAVNNGLLGVQLGSTVNPLPKTALNNPVWLGIQIGSDTEAIPRTALNSTNNAFRAEEADLLNGLQANEIISAASDEVRTPISSLPYSITAPGSYYLTGNLSLTVSGVGISVLVSDVTIDLMGFTVSGAGSSSSTGSHGVDFTNRNNIVIKNGTLRDWGGVGIFQGNSSNQNSKIMDVSSLSNIRVGLLLRGSNNHIERCIVTDNGFEGIYTDKNAFIQGNTVKFNNGRGIQTDFGSLVKDNVISGNQGDYGLYVFNDSTVINNTVQGNSNRGLYAGDGSTVSTNTVNNNGDIGIITGIGTTITGNTVSSNGGRGISAGDRTRIVANNVSSNAGDYGILTGLHSTVTDNTVSSNVNGGISAGSGTNIIGNKITDHTQWGLYAGAVSLIKDNLIHSSNTSNTAGVGGIRVAKKSNVVGNTVTYSSVDGIRLDGADTVVEGNHVTGNAAGGVTTNGYNFVAGGNFYKDNRAADNTINYTGVVPGGTGDGGGNVGF